MLVFTSLSMTTLQCWNWHGLIKIPKITTHVMSCRQRQRYHSLRHKRFRVLNSMKHRTSNEKGVWKSSEISTRLPPFPGLRVSHAEKPHVSGSTTTRCRDTEMDPEVRIRISLQSGTASAPASSSARFCQLLSLFWNEWTNDSSLQHKSIWLEWIDCKMSWMCKIKCQRWFSGVGAWRKASMQRGNRGNYWE